MADVIQVGKYTLESLTTGMYSDPKIIYREYIQNSVDSLETAVEANLLEPQSMRIDILVDAENSYIAIRDNGTGIATSKAVPTLMNIGSSTKRHSNNRGFRGIGRLGGMSYCSRLVFSTSAENETTKTIVEFDCKKLRQLLVPGANDYFREPQGLDDLSEGLGLPVAAIGEMTYREVCRQIADRVPFLEVSGRSMGTVLWPMTEPYRHEHERYQQGFRFSSQDIAAGGKRAKKWPGAPVPAWYPYITYYMAIVELYGEDEALLEALCRGLVDSGCGSVIPLHKYLHIIREMKCIPREEIIFDLLIRPFLRPLAEDR